MVTCFLEQVKGQRQQVSFSVPTATLLKQLKSSLRAYMEVFMSSFDNYIMDHYEKMWEEQKEEDHEPEE